MCHGVHIHRQLDCLFTIQENIKAPDYWPFVRGTGYLWITLTKDQ